MNSKRDKHSFRVCPFPPNRPEWAGLFLAFLLLLWTGMPTPAGAQAVPNPGTIIDLGTLGGDYSDAFGINNDPTVVQVVGQSRRVDFTVHAFFWTPPGPMIDLGTLGGDSNAFDINNYGQIAGSSFDALQQYWAVVWTMTGSSSAVETLPTLTGACCAQAYGINNGTADDLLAVKVVGHSATASGEHHAVVWTKSAAGWEVHDLGTLPGHQRSFANDVNDDGAIVGSSFSTAGIATGFLRTAAGMMFALSTLGGETYANAINNNGDVCGVSTDAAGHPHAVRWIAATNWKTIEDLGTLGGCCSDGEGINGLGDVVGASNFTQSLTAGKQRAFLKNSSGMHNLGALLRGSRVSVARDLNDFGSVVGASSGGSGNDKFMHAVLWTQPTAW